MGACCSNVSNVPEQIQPPEQMQVAISTTPLGQSYMQSPEPEQEIKDG
jgi:hypothetical protein